MAKLWRRGIGQVAVSGYGRLSVAKHGPGSEPGILMSSVLLIFPTVEANWLLVLTIPLLRYGTLGKSETDGHPPVAASCIGKPIAELKGHQQVVYLLPRFSPKGDVLISADTAGILTVWDMPHADKPRTLTGHTDWIWSAAFSPDGRLLASASTDKTARVWDVEYGNQVAQLPLTLPLDTVKYKGDARCIRRALKWLEEGSEYSAEIKAIAFSPCGTVIAGGLCGAKYDYGMPQHIKSA